MAVYDGQEYSRILDAFKKGRSRLNDISVEIVGDENNLPPLVLLRAYESDPSIDVDMDLTVQMVMNRQVKFMRDGKVIHEFFYKGGDLSDHFTNCPYLLDVLMKLCYGLMVKKLTPPSSDSETEERQ